METSVQGKNLELTPHIQEYAKDKLSHLGDIHHSIVGLAVRVGKETEFIKTASAVWTLKGRTIRIEEKDCDAYAAIDKLADASKVALERAKNRGNERRGRVSRRDSHHRGEGDL